MRTHGLGPRQGSKCGAAEGQESMENLNTYVIFAGVLLLFGMIAWAILAD